VNLMDVGKFNGRRFYIGVRLDYRLRLWAPTATSHLTVRELSFLLEQLDAFSINVPYISLSRLRIHLCSQQIHFLTPTSLL